jgi:hypothetical protein
MQKREFWVILVGVIFFVSMIGYVDNSLDGMLSKSTSFKRGVGSQLSGSVDSLGGEDYPSGIKAWYKFDDDPSNGVSDSSGNHYYGSCTNCPELISGKFDYAYSFNGIDDYIDLGDPLFGIDTSDELTISFWINPSSVSGIQEIIERGQYLYPYGIRLYDGELRFYLRTDHTSPYLSSNTFFDTGVWYHVVLTYKNGDRRMYINGNVDAQDSYTGSISTNQESTYIGNKPVSNKDYFNGLLDEFIIYDRALSEGEVGSLFEGGSGSGSGSIGLECRPGHVRYCDDQKGVCYGSLETCTPYGTWDGCDYNVYYNWDNEYEEPYETKCDDTLDNDCDGYTDMDDPSNCQGGPGDDEYYIRSDADAGGDGSDWDNAWQDLNDAGDLERGHTYWIADGDYDSYTFNDGKEGELYITIKKAVDQGDHGTEVGWVSTYGDGVAEFISDSPETVWIFKRPYYILDGQTGGGPGSWKTGFGFRITTIGFGGPTKLIKFVDGSNTNHVQIRHVELAHRGVTYPLVPDDAIYQDIGGIPEVLNPGDPRLNSHDLTFSHCYIHDTARTCALTGRGHNITFEYSYFERNHNQGSPGYGMCGLDPEIRCNEDADCDYLGNYICRHIKTSTGGNTNNYTCVKDNNQACFDFEYHTDCDSSHYCVIMGQQHSEAIADYATADMEIKYNIFDDISGTAAIANKKNYDEISERWKIHGNVFFHTSPDFEGVGMGVVASTSTATGYCIGFEVHHNTISEYVGINSGVNLLPGMDNHAYNNLWFNSSKAGFHDVENDYNVFVDTSIAYGSQNGSHGYFDTGNPFTAPGEYYLKEPTQPGDNLGSPFDIDYDGNQRGADGNWDRGAIEYVN